MIELKKTRAGYVLPLMVSAGASRDRISGDYGGRLKVAVSAPPEDGKANRAVEEMLAEKLGVSRSCVHVVSGQTSRRKEVLVERAPKSALEAIIS